MSVGPYCVGMELESTLADKILAGKSRYAAPGLPFLANLTAFSTWSGMREMLGGLAEYLL